MKSLVPDTYLISWQDWRHHQFNTPVPVLHRERIEGKEAAEARKAELTAVGILCNVARFVVSRKETRQTVSGGHTFNEAWKLHR